MPIDEARYRELLERIDPKVKLKRLEEELNGDEQRGTPGLREQLLMALRQYEAQKRLVEKRKGARSGLEKEQFAAFDAGQQEAELNLKMFEMQVELFAEEIEKTEAQIDEVKKSGLTDTKGNGATPMRVPRR